MDIDRYSDPQIHHQQRPADPWQQPVIEHLSPNDPQPPLIGIEQSASYSYQGPIPDPGMLARYNEVDPTFADRIMRMAEDNMAATNEGIRSYSRAESRAITAGAIASIGLPALGILVTVVLIIFGYPVGALIAAIPTILFATAAIINASRGRTPQLPGPPADSETGEDD